MSKFETIIKDEQVAALAREQIAKIQSVVDAHGGGVEILRAYSDELVIGLKGHCAGCPLAPMTFGVVLNKHLKDAMPQLKSIKYMDISKDEQD